jgi:alpha-ketoglutarate-dependent taurine dioxygenase
VGQEEAGETLDEERTLALLDIERRLGESEYQVEFSLDPGQMLFTNNHWILHNRTAFEDYREVERRRHYVRLWLDRRV